MNESELRAIDERIAVEVMGFRGVGFYGPTKPRGSHADQILCASAEKALALYRQHWPAAVVRDHVEGRLSLSHWKDGCGTLMLDEYSTDIYAAWAVVEKMRERGWQFNIFSPNSEGGEWEAEFSRPGPVHADELWANEVAAETAPLAICGAALAALGSEASRA